MIWLSVFLVLILLAISAFFAAAETAVTAASPGKIQKAKPKNAKKANIVFMLLKQKEYVISSLLIVNSAINTIATTIATAAFISLLGDDGTIIASAVMSVMIIVFAEVIPKAIAVARAESVILTSSNIVVNALRILQPINFLLSLILRLFCYIFRIKLTQNVSGTEEVRGIIEHHMEEGNVFKSDGDMLGGILDLGNLTVSEIMIHRFQMTSLDADLPVKDITAQAIESSHTRIPLWQKTKDNIVGILHIRDLVRSLHSNNFDYSKIHIQDFISKPWFIPDHALVSHQLHSFRQKRIHLALVIDEYGVLLGMLTLEDILEEIVGQIEDEHDNISQRIIKKSHNIFIIDGSTSIRDINRALDWNLPDHNAATIAGLIIHEIHKIPEPGEVFQMLNLKITIKKRISNRIKTIMVELLNTEKE